MYCPVCLTFLVRIFYRCFPLIPLGPMLPGGGPRMDHRARIQFGRVHFGVFSTSRFVHSARIGPDLLCHCHPSSVICHPLDWIIGPYYSLSWVHFEGKCNFWVGLFKGLNSGALRNSFPIKGGASCQVGRHISIIYRLLSSALYLER